MSLSVLIYLKSQVREGELPSAGSLHRWSAEARSQELHLGLVHGCWWTTSLSHLCYLPRNVSRSWIGSGAGETQTNAHEGCQYCMWQLDTLHHRAIVTFSLNVQEFPFVYILSNTCYLYFLIIIIITDTICMP